MNKEKMYNRFINKIYELVGNEYILNTPNDRFINTNHKVEICHKKCGSVFLMEGKRFIAGDRCPVCANEKRRMKKTLSEETLIKRIENIHPEIEYIGGFKNVNSKIDARCKKCGFTFQPTPVNLLRKNKPTGCPKCSKNPRKNTEYFRNEVYSIVGDEYKVLSDYKNNYTHVDMLHTICNNTYKVTPSSFLNGRRCPFCNGGVRLSQEEARKRIYENSEKEYDLISEYKNNNTLVKIKHLKCNNEYYTTTNLFVSGFGRCPFCNETTGEHQIRKYLENHKYQFIFQYKIKDFSNKMSFDFFDVDNDILIEYDGIFHYIPFNENSLDEFMLQKERDIKKNEYCHENNISLLRIPFWLYDNINEILDIFYEDRNLKHLEEKYIFDFNKLEISYIEKFIKNKKVFESYKDNLFNLNDYRKDNLEIDE